MSHKKELANESEPKEDHIASAYPPPASSSASSTPKHSLAFYDLRLLPNSIKCKSKRVRLYYYDLRLLKRQPLQLFAPLTTRRQQSSSDEMINPNEVAENQSSAANQLWNCHRKVDRQSKLECAQWIYQLFSLSVHDRFGLRPELYKLQIVTLLLQVTIDSKPIQLNTHEHTHTCLPATCMELEPNRCVSFALSLPTFLYRVVLIDFFMQVNTDKACKERSLAAEEGTIISKKNKIWFFRRSKWVFSTHTHLVTLLLSLATMMIFDIWKLLQQE